MSKLADLVADVRLPEMIEMKQSYPRPVLKDIAGEVHKQLDSSGVGAQIRPGASIALTGGSRGIANIALILKEAAAYVKAKGGNPFIIPAMGSHGGAVAEGQTEILASLGITESYCGCPIRSSMETDLIGITEVSQIPVYEDHYAHQADGVILVNRIKPHPSFSGNVESGVCKMAAVGLGKQKGAAAYHRLGIGNMSKTVQEVACYLFEHGNIIGGIGTVENAYDETALIEAMTTEHILEREAELLKIAYENFPQIYFKKYDVLLVEEMGKNISGAGMDTMIISRYTHDGIPNDKRQQTVCVLDLTEETHGNACGMGLADIITKRYAEHIDFMATYPNNLTSRVLGSCKMPLVTDNDYTAIQTAIHCCTGIDYNRVKLIWIQNTLDISRIMISRSLYEEWENNREQYPYMEQVGEFHPIEFTADGTLVRLPRRA